jgi:Ca2+-binding EF-hand superfamily protein
LFCQREIETVVNADDGVFWMSFKDFITYFYRIYICMAKAHTSNPWREERRQFYFELEKQHTNAAAAPSSPANLSFKTSDQYKMKSSFFRFTVTKKDSFIITLHQQDKRIQGTPEYLDLGFIVLKRVSGPLGYEFVFSTGTKIKRQNQSKEKELDVGEYVILPFSTGCKLRQYYEDRERSSGDPTPLIYRQEASAEPLQFTKEGLKIFTEVFHRLDTANQGFLGKAQLDVYMEKTAGKKLSDSSFGKLLSSYVTGPGQGISLAAFLAVQLDIVAQMCILKPTENAETIFRNELKAFDYQEVPCIADSTRSCLEWIKGRYTALSIHSSTDADFQVAVIPFDEVLYEFAQESYLLRKGTKTAHRYYNVYEIDNGKHGISMMVENSQNRPLELTLDISGSYNILASTNEKVIKITLPPHGTQTIFQVLPKDEGSWNCRRQFSSVRL